MFGQPTLAIQMFPFVSIPDRVTSASITMWRACKVCLRPFFSREYMVIDCGRAKYYCC